MEKERLKYCIERWDHYYDSVNNKSSVFLGLSTFIVGGLVAAYPSLLDNTECGVFTHVLMLTLIGLGITIMIIVVMASTPFLSKPQESLLYFGAVSRLTEDGFQRESSLVSEETELIDLRRQAYQLSKGLSRKFKKLRMAGLLFTIQFFLFAPLVLIIVCNLK